MGEAKAHHRGQVLQNHIVLPKPITCPIVRFRRWLCHRFSSKPDLFSVSLMEYEGKRYWGKPGEVGN